MPAWGLLVLPVAFLVVTWAWSGDWLLDRPAPGRWVRLGLILAGTCDGLRPDTPAGVPGASPTPGRSRRRAPGPPHRSRCPPDRNAAELYREAGRRLKAWTVRQRASRDGGVDAASRSTSKQHPEIFDLIRRAAARPECRFRARAARPC